MYFFYLFVSLRQRDTKVLIINFSIYRSLESLTLQENNFVVPNARPALQTLAKALKNMKNCVILRLIDNTFKDGEMNLILKDLIENQSIRTFHLINVRFSDALIDFIRGNKRVDDFTLSLIDPDERNMKKIAMALEFNQTLIHIDMSFMSYYETKIQSIIKRNILIRRST